MSLTLFSWLLALSAGISLSLSLFALARRAVTGSLPFALALFGEFTWCAGYWCELNAPGLDGKLFWDNVQFLGTDLGVLGALLFAYAYTGYETWLQRYGALLVVPPAIMALLVWSNPLHELVRSAPQIVSVGGLHVLAYTYGPWFWVFVGYNYLLTLATLGLLIAFALESRSYRQPVFTFVIGFSAPAVGALLTVFGLIPIPGLERLDISALTFAITSPLMAWALFHKRMLDLVPIARTLLIEQMRDAVLVADMQARVVDANAQALRLLQRPGERIIGTPIHALLPTLVQLMTAAGESGRADLRIDQQPPIDIEADITSLRDRRDARLGWLVVLRDITAPAQQARYQHALADCSQILLRSGQHVVGVDELLDTVLGLLRKAAGVGRIDVCQNILGADGELHAQIIAEERSPEVPPFPLTACLPWSMLPAMRAALAHGQVLSGPVAHLFAASPPVARALADGGVQAILLMPLYGAGIWWGILRASADRPDQPWDEPTIEFLRAAADMIAVSVRQWEATRTLREREHFIQRVAHATPDMIYVYDLQAQRLIYANTSTAPSGHAPEQIVGIHPPDGAALRPDERAQRLAYAERIAAAADQEVCSLEYCAQAADARSVWLLRRDTIFARDAAGVPTQILGVVQDITERRRRAQALLQAKDEAEAANRAKSTFLSMMSHELRTPLTAIIGYSQLLEQLMAIGDYRTVTTDLHHIYTAGKHLLALINDVLDLSRIEAGRLHVEIHPTDLPDLIRDVASTVGPLVERSRNTLRIDCPSLLAPMDTDATKLRQVLLNLLNNAAKFTESGTITLSVAQELVDNVPWVVFRVADTGIGIDIQQMPKLFKAFSQVDESLNRRYGGTGLGLALSQRLCQLLGGDITVESQLGVGSVFSVRLPMHAAGDAEVRIELSETPPPPLIDSEAGAVSDVIVLVIDASPAASALIARTIGPERAHVVHAASGPRGIELARDLLPELIVFDMLLPTLEDGMRALVALKADPELADIPVFIVNTDDLDTDEQMLARLTQQLRHIVAGGCARAA